MTIVEELVIPEVFIPSVKLVKQSCVEKIIKQQYGSLNPWAVPNGRTTMSPWELYLLNRVYSSKF